jgi:cytochrome c oxidase subunit IV
MKAGAHEGFVEHGLAKAPSDRKFGVTVGGILMVLSAARWWIGHFGPLTAAMAILGGVLVLLGIVLPGVLGPLNRAWMRLGAALAAIVNPIVMLLMFALIFTPVALVMRARSRDGLGLRRKPVGESYWHVREPVGPAAERLRHQF